MDIEKFVKTNFKQLAGTECVLFPLSSRMALEAKKGSYKKEKKDKRNKRKQKRRDVVNRKRKVTFF